MNLESSHSHNTPAQEAIALLIDLAKQGEIDPWDVQVIDVIDRCLDALAQYSQAKAGSFEADLSQSGQAFLYASMLVLLKADTLLNAALTPDEPEELIVIDDVEVDINVNGQLPLHLERHIRRRLSAQPPQRRPVTLQDLIDQLQKMAAELETKPAHVPTKRPKQSNSQAMRAIAELAHQENLTETAAQLEEFLKNYCLQRASGQEDWIALDNLVQLWGKQVVEVEHHHGTIDHQVNERVGLFWALLLLSAQSKVELAQEEFYQDINIRLLEDSLNQHT